MAGTERVELPLTEPEIRCPTTRRSPQFATSCASQRKEVLYGNRPARATQKFWRSYAVWLPPEQARRSARSLGTSPAFTASRSCASTMPHGRAPGSMPRSRITSAPPTARSRTRHTPPDARLPAQHRGSWRQAQPHSPCTRAPWPRVGPLEVEEGQSQLARLDPAPPPPALRASGAWTAPWPGSRSRGGRHEGRGRRASRRRARPASPSRARAARAPSSGCPKKWPRPETSSLQPGRLGHVVQECRPAQRGARPPARELLHARADARRVLEHVMGVIGALLVKAGHRRELGARRPRATANSWRSAHARAPWRESRPAPGRCARTRWYRELGRTGLERRLRRGLDQRAQPAGKAHRAQHAQRVLLEALARLPHRADDARREVLLATKGIEQAALGVKGHRVHGEVAARQVLAHVP